MKYVISGAYYNWYNHSRNQWLKSWIYWQRDRQLVSGSDQQTVNRKRIRKVKR